MNKQNKSYDRYGGCGLTVCGEWLSDSKIFYRWAISNGWEKGLELDRVDNRKGYTPSNCRFVSRMQNARNKRNSKYWYVFGHKFCSLVEAAKVHNVSNNTIKAWCEGRVTGGRHHPQLEKCYSVKKYNEEKPHEF